MSPTMAGIAGFAALILLMFLRMPIGFVMAIVGYVGFGLLVSWSAAGNLLIRDIYSTFSAYNLTVIPLFVLMGQIAFHAGISGRLFLAAHRFFGHLPGGLAIATIGACAGFSAVCGSTSATAATMARDVDMIPIPVDPACVSRVTLARLRGGRDADAARQFMQFCANPRGQGILRRKGFRVEPPDGVLPLHPSEGGGV